MRSIYLNICTLFASAALLASCNDDQLIESNHTLIPSETISFDATAGWPEEDPDSRALNRVGKYMLSSVEAGDLLPLGVYVQEGIHPVNEDTPQSRGAVFEIKDLKSFNVWATYTNTDNEPTSFFGDTGLKFSENNGVYSSTDIYYWPGSGAFKFVALGNVPDENFTVSADGTSLTYTVPDNATEQKDIIMAVASADGNHNQTVPLTFNHILTAVNVKIGDVPAGTINSITFKNIYNKGTYGVDGWTTSKKEDDLHDFSVIFNEDALNSEGKYVTNDQASGTLINGNGATFMMIPQTLESGTNKPVEMVVNFTHSATNNTEDLHASLEGHVWSMGNTTNYMINITPDFVLDIVETSVPIADCHYDTRIINISDESNVGWTLSSDVDWVKFRIVPDDYETNAFKDYWIEKHTVQNIYVKITSTGEQSQPKVETTEEEPSNYLLAQSIDGCGTKKVLVYFYENAQTSNSSTTNRTTRLKLLNANDKECDYINIYQYYPLWNSSTMAYERIEENDFVHPWGFASNRIIKYTYPTIDNIWGAPGSFGYRLLMFFKEGLFGILNGIYQWATTSAREERSELYNYFVTTYDEESADDFITLEGNANSQWSATLNYAALNNINTTGTGYENTLKIISSTGGGATGSDAETWLENNNFTTDGASTTTDATTIRETAAYQAVLKNAWNLTTTQTITTTFDENNVQQGEPNVQISNDIQLAYGVKWFLPSKDEIATLKQTACDDDATNNDEALSGTYWTSTSGSGTTSSAYDGATSSLSSPERTAKNKIRAARIKP